MPTHIKTKKNQRKILLAKLRRDKNPETKASIRKLDKDISYFYHSNKRKDVRRQIIAGNPGSLWNAVKVSKDLNVENLPEKMFENNVEIQKSRFT